MAEVVPLDAAERPLHSAQVLVGHALDGGGHDNVTVAVVPFPAPPAGGRIGLRPRSAGRPRTGGDRSGHSHHPRSRTTGALRGTKKAWPISRSRTCRSSRSTSTRTSTCPRAAARSTRSSR